MDSLQDEAVDTVAPAASTADNYWDVLPSGQDRDFTFAHFDPRFCDFKIEATVTTSTYGDSTLVVNGLPQLYAPQTSGSGGCDWSDPLPSSPAHNVYLEPLPSAPQERQDMSMRRGSAEHDVLLSSSRSPRSPGQGPGSGALDTGVQVELFPVSSLLLAAKSLHFRALLNSGVCDAARRIPVQLHPAELSALSALLRFLYTCDVPLAEMGVAEVVRLLLLADRLQVPSLLRAIIAHLQVRAVTPAAASLYLDLPAHLAPLLRPLHAKAVRFVNRHFQRLDVLLFDDDLREDFMQLSLPAVKSLLWSQEVTVSCEDTVFIALQLWAQGQGLPPSAFHAPPYLQLLAALRYAHMTPSFLSDKVARAASMQSDDARRMINEGRIFRTAPDSFRTRMVADANHCRYLQRPPPPTYPYNVGGKASLLEGSVSSMLTRWGSYMLGLPLPEAPDTPPPAVTAPRAIVAMQKQPDDSVVSLRACLPY